MSLIPRGIEFRTLCMRVLLAIAMLTIGSAPDF
jgi:hypothetical protein